MENNYKPLVSFMPLSPSLYNAYVPYQLNVDEFELEEACNKGTLYESLYSPYIGNVKGDEVLCNLCKWTLIR